MAKFLSRRTTTILLTLLGVFLAGTVVFLATVNAYFSIDNSAYILPEELGTWDEIRFGSSPDGPDSWAARIPWLAKMTGMSAPAPEGSKVNAIGAQVAEPASETASTWRNNTVKSYDPSNPPEKIPRIIHQTWKDEHLPPRWQAIRDECAAMHPDYEYMLWTDADSRTFIAEHYPWFIKVFDEYPYPIQRADAIRYFVLHHYGGVYMDLDIGCLRRLDNLLRFEIILPKTIPVGVSNDLLFAEKGHPFMDQLIHNLVTFNHQYLSHYPTVMFSTGPMFVSASYGLYVDVHGPAMPSKPTQPEAGFKGIRILPKSLYGKNAKPGEAPDAFFSHFYGSSWHANDAGFLIFLRDHGRFLMFIGACVVGYGAFRIMLPKFMWRFEGPGGGSRRPRSDRGGRWVSLPVGSGPSLSRHHSKRKSTADNQEMPLDDMTAGASSSSAAPGSRLSMPAPRPHRLSLPLFQLQDQENMNREPQSVLAWVGQTFSRPSSRNDGAGDTESPATNGSPRTKKGGVLYLPAYFVSRGDDSSSSQLSPSSSSSSSPPAWQGHGTQSGSLGNWAASLLPASWRGPSPAPSNASRREDVDVESVCSDEESYTGGAGEQSAPLLRNGSGAGRFARSWTDDKTCRDASVNTSAITDTPECFDRSNPFEGKVGPNGTLLANSSSGTSVNQSLMRRLPSSGDLHAAEDTPISTLPPPPYPYTTPEDEKA